MMQIINNQNGKEKTMEQVPVLIVGAGSAGLSLSLLLLQQGIQSILIEKRRDISWVPRARNLNFRTFEVFRGLELKEEVDAVAGADISQVIFQEHLNDPSTRKVIDPNKLIEYSASTSPDPLARYCPQSHLEPVLRAAAIQRGGDVRYDTELISFMQDSNGVTSTLQEHSTGKTYIIHSDYLVAADGAHSRIRETLGIATKGFGVLPEYFIFVYFTGSWKKFTEGHESDGFMIRNADVQGIFLNADKERGMFMIMYRPAKGESVTDFTPERCKKMINMAIGEEVGIEIIKIAPWQPAESVADRFHEGRVFLVGDSAHTMPAYKGLGANTAIQSAQNLAWKIAMVLKQKAPQALLKTYQTERHPVGMFAAEQSLTGPGADWIPKTDHDILLPKQKEFPLFFPIVGYRYCSAAIISEEANTSPEESITLLDIPDLTGIPGSRVPHLWLERDGKRISTLDLFNGKFVLLTGADGDAWRKAAEAVKLSSGINLSAYGIGKHAAFIDTENKWKERMGVTQSGAVLVRPDSFIAWRAKTLASDPQGILKDVLQRILNA